MSTRWEQRALPVLRAVANPTGHYIREGILFVGHGRDSGLGVDLPAAFLHDTVLQLADLGYVQFDEVNYDGGGGATFIGVRITGRGLQVLGQWPDSRPSFHPGLSPPSSSNWPTTPLPRRGCR
jgi:hypothetical protein